MSGFDDYKAMETRMFEMGYQRGMEKAKAEMPAGSYAGLETTRSARAKKKKKRATELKTLAQQKK